MEEGANSPKSDQFKKGCHARMRRKWLSLLLAFALLLSLCPAALAAEGEIRETDFFTEQEHGDVDFQDMAYEHMEAEPILEEMEAVRALLDNKANAKEVEERFAALTEQFSKAATMYTLADIHTSMDVTDEYYKSEKLHTHEVYLDLADALCLLVKDILNSGCAGFLKEQLSEDDMEFYLTYEEMTEEEKTLSTAVTANESEYDTVSDAACVEYNGQEMDYYDIYYGYLNGELDRDAYLALNRELLLDLNQDAGEIYLELVEQRQELARLAGYDNFAEYAYEEVYQRDYTPEEIQEFHAAVKEHMVPLANALDTLASSIYAVKAYQADYTGETALDMMEPYIGRMSSELAEALAYMRDHGLFDSVSGDHKDGRGYTTILDSYSAPFFFNTPSGNLVDFTTAVHEFGHYNNFYWQPSGWNDDGKSIDIAEVHSQGLELLFSHWYPEIFGEEGDDILIYQMSNLASAIIQGALYDEFQQYVYTMEDLTLEKLNSEFLRLNVEYGELPESYVDADDGLWADIFGCQWVQIPHNFSAPCYYISYAVSAAGAFAFWLEAQEGDYFQALDNYLKFTALDASYGFQESFAEAGVDSPVSEEYVAELADALWTALDVDARLEAMEQESAAFSDISEEDWFYQYVTLMVLSGAIEGYEDGTFRPYEPAVWGMLHSDILALEELGVDAESAVTRLDFCRALAGVMGGLPAGDAAPSPFSDTEDSAVAALAELGIIGGYADGTFRPDQTMTRAELCTALGRTVLLMASLMGGEQAA